MRSVRSLALLGAFCKRPRKPSLLACLNHFCIASASEKKREAPRGWSWLAGCLISCLVCSFASFYPCTALDSLDGEFSEVSLDCNGLAWPC